MMYIHLTNLEKGIGEFVSKKSEDPFVVIDIHSYIHYGLYVFYSLCTHTYIYIYKYL